MRDVLGDAVASALMGVARSIPSMSISMVVDGVSGNAVLCSSVDKASPGASANGAEESRRICASVRDFPLLTEESLIELDSIPYIVTSLRKTGNAAWFIGLSGEMDEVVVSYSGRRREDGMVRSISISLPSLMSPEESSEIYTDAVGVSSSSKRYVVIRSGDWAYPSAPEVGDCLVAYVDGVRRTMNIAEVTAHAGYYLLVARGR